MSDLLASIAAHCGALSQPGARVAAGIFGMFLLGAGGSLSHCGAMCGPLVVGQVTDRLARVPAARLCEAHRLRAGLLLPYHAGRLFTYATLGAAAGAAGLAFVTVLSPLRTVLLLLAAMVLLGTAFGWRLPTDMRAFRWARGIDRGGAFGTFLFGMVLGLLPCGLLYAALVAACALASPLRGAAGMIAFGAGTIPILAIIGIAGRARPFRTALARARPWLMAFNAAVLVVAALA